MQNWFEERAVGTEGNARLNDELARELSALGYAVKALPLECVVWEHAPSSLRAGEQTVSIHPSPYSGGFEGALEAASADSMDELAALDCAGKLLLLGGALASEAIQPIGYPFYYPDEHRALHELLARKAPAAILAGTGADAMSGLDPFPLFDDGNFPIPSAYIDRATLARVREALAPGARAFVRIASATRPARAAQLVASRQGDGGRVLLAAHIDTKNGSPGALDNGAGVCVLLEAAKALAQSGLAVDVVPFNGEEYFAASGEMSYLDLLTKRGETPALMINIDSPCHLGSKLAVSAYNLTPAMTDALNATLRRHPLVEPGDAWYAGDHAIFAFQSVPCLALSSADLFTGALARTHTPADLPETVDPALFAPAARFVAEVAEAVGRGGRGR